MNTAQWFFGRDGVQQGPVGEAELRQKLASGEVRATDLVWREGMPQWQPAAQVAELSASLANAPAPAMGPPPLRPARPIAPQYASPPRAYPGMPPVHQPPGIGQDAGMRMLIPVGRSGWAIASGYLGLLSVFPFIGTLFGIAAVITGILAIRDIKRNPQRHGMGRAIFGIIFGVLFGVLWVIGLAAAMSSASSQRY